MVANNIDVVSSVHKSGECDEQAESGTPCEKKSTSVSVHFAPEPQTAYGDDDTYDDDMDEITMNDYNLAKLTNKKKQYL